VLAAGLVLACGASSPASAELVFLTTGRVVSVEALESVDAKRIRLVLRQGGEIVCARALIARVAPDELSRMPAPAPLARVQVPVQPPGSLDAIIDAASARHGVDRSLLRAVIEVESAFQADARSPEGAMGLMQLMPGTAAEYAVGDPFDAAENVEAGTRHLRRLLDLFEMPVALAAYNAGEGAVARFGGMPPFRETRAYVARILQLIQ
jgi:soluble lytic murein transglycosylase-like protein